MKIKYITIVPILLMMFIIFMYSSQPGQRSDKSSFAIVDEVMELYEKINEQLNIGIHIKEQPTDSMDSIKSTINFFVRKTAHVSVYTALSFFSCIHMSQYFYKEEKITNDVKYTTWKGITYYNTIRLYLYAILISILFSCSDELHQRFIPGRSGNIKDIGIDSIGILLGCILFYFLYKFIQRFIVFIINKFQFLN